MDLAAEFYDNILNLYVNYNTEHDLEKGISQHSHQQSYGDRQSSTLNTNDDSVLLSSVCIDTR
jgi:hypothetical protein